MFKARTLDFEYGLDLPSHMYSSTTSSLGKIAQAISNGYDTIETLTEKRSYGIAHANTAWPDQTTGISGYETFYSTRKFPPNFNNCAHNVSRGCNYPYTASFEGYRGNCYLEYFYRVIPWCSNLNVETLRGHHNVDLSTAQRTAWGYMQPRFEGDIDMFNFIIELKDFKSLARFLMNKPIKKLSNYFRRIKKMQVKRKPNWMHSISKKTDYTLTGPLASMHLTNEFALKPLIADIVNITCQMEQIVSEVQQNFADAGRERNTRHYSELIPVGENACVDPYYLTRYPERFWGFNEQLTFTATMEYSYKYNMRSTLDAFMEYWGLSSNEERIWNALPGSFIIDYFLKVGDSLAINSRDKNVDLQLYQYCESLLSERSVGAHIRANKLIGPLLGTPRDRSPGGEGKYLLAGSECSFYTRYLSQPLTGRVMPRIHKPTSRQGWNLAALTRCFF